MNTSFMFKFNAIGHTKDIGVSNKVIKYRCPEYHIIEANRYISQMKLCTI